VAAGSVRWQVRQSTPTVTIVTKLSLTFVALGLLLGAPLTVRATTAPAPLLPDGALDSLNGSLRAFLIHELPSPLYTSSKNWGNTKRVANGVKWHHAKPEMQKAPKNDGVWTRLTLTTPNIQNSLILDLRNLQQTANGPTTFDLFLSFDANVEYERQNWKAGVRVYSGSTRVRFRVKLALKCEVTSRFERHGSAVPDLVFRMRVARADVTYDNLVFEHVLGLGGEAAKLIGDAVKGGIHKFHPSLEHDMLTKANAAIVKAADTKEIRVGLSRLTGQK
jgi:hypothetical protein